MPQTLLGQWIRKNRQQAKLSQTQLGTELQVHQVTISNWETGKAEPDPDGLRALEALFRDSAPQRGAASPTQPRRPPRGTGPAVGRTTRPPKQTKTKAGVQTADFRHVGELRTNIPAASLAAEGHVPRLPRASYSYDPHLPPTLRVDESGRADLISDRLDKLIAKAGAEVLSSEEQKELRSAICHRQPWLEWSNKHEQHRAGGFEVDPLSLHIHERVSAQALIRAARRRDLQRDLFADPQLPYRQAVQFYRHDVDWTNRMILGDSLQVMTSLARRERLAGKVQMIYVDPPYGIKFNSNFQWSISNRNVRDGSDTHLTREPEQIQAYRDTWRLGIHSYLSYLRDRLIAARDLLSDTGSLFLQISNDNVHRVRCVLDDVFGSANAISTIATRKASPDTLALKNAFNYVLWYAKDSDNLASKKLFRQRRLSEGTTQDPKKLALWLRSPDGFERPLSTPEKRQETPLPPDSVVFRADKVRDGGQISDRVYDYDFQGELLDPGPGHSWRGTPTELERLRRSERLLRTRQTLAYKYFLSDSWGVERTNLWEDTAGKIPDMRYIVETNEKIVSRCVLLSTEPGDLVLDPTCGSGTTARVAEQWGRRWITIDTSRVALAIARERLLTATYDLYATTDREGRETSHPNPGTGFHYKSWPHVTLKSIAQNSHLDPLFEKHDSILDQKLATVNEALSRATDSLKERLATKLREKKLTRGARSITTAETRRWLLPPLNRTRPGATQSKRTIDVDAPYWYEWEVPFDVDSDWPEELQQAVTEYRKAWRTKMKDVNACIERNAPHERLVDQPEVVNNVLRVSGPFTVEGVMPAEFTASEQELAGGAPHTRTESSGVGTDSANEKTTSVELRNVSAYLHRMTQLLQTDGVTFPNNQHRSFARLEPLFEDGSGSAIHAEGLWHGDDDAKPSNVAIAFGPQYGPVTAGQVKELIQACRGYDDLVVAGFSFEADATAILLQERHLRPRTHQAHVRPDINPAMDGLLKEPRGPVASGRASGETRMPVGNHQLFTVFGLPEIEIREANGSPEEHVCELLGVDVYDPITGEVKSTGAAKVAAWFLDSDYDGRCFCIAQAFFPNRNAWTRVRKALNTSADSEAFEALKGTISLPFGPGQHRRIAVKVIDPRGNEVMAIHALEA